MLSVVIATQDDAFRLVPTLAALVPGATAGLVTEVIVADGGSTDDTADVADIAGCKFLEAAGPRGPLLAAAAQAARGPWLMFLPPGGVPDQGWVEDVRRFIESAPNGGAALAAVFRRAPVSGAVRPVWADIRALAADLIGAVPEPAQGLIIAGRHYRHAGGHLNGPAPEADLLRRLGRRQLATLRSGITATADRKSG